MTQSKYRNVATEIDGVRFASAKEARTYQALKLLERGKVITGLKLQPRYALVVNGHKVCTYVGDFQFCEKGKAVVGDAKGYRTQAYIIKKKLFQALYPEIEHREF